MNNEMDLDFFLKRNRVWLAEEFWEKTTLSGEYFSGWASVGFFQEEAAGSKWVDEAPTGSRRLEYLARLDLPETSPEEMKDFLEGR